MKFNKNIRIMKKINLLSLKTSKKYKKMKKGEHS